MRVHTRFLGITIISCLLVACAQQPATATDPVAASSPQPHGNLAQMMRSIAFSNSNIIFDAQSNDPEARMAAAKAAAQEPGGDPYGGTYGGWSGVEESGVAISETANLLTIPGRKCSNGLDVPVDREDWKQFSQNLADAGVAVQKAAQSKSMDAIVDVSGTLSDACLACHEVYRDQPAPKQRCTF